LAWKAIERPAAFIIGRSLAPSPTAIAWPGGIAEAVAAPGAGPALLGAVADVAPGLVDHAAGEPSVLDAEDVGTDLVDREERLHPLGEEGEAAGYQQRVQSRGPARPDEALDAGLRRSRSS
jgi:hypothetical protein